MHYFLTLRSSDLQVLRGRPGHGSMPACDVGSSHRALMRKSIISIVLCWSALLPGAAWACDMQESWMQRACNRIDEIWTTGSNDLNTCRSEEQTYEHKSLIRNTYTV